MGNKYTEAQKKATLKYQEDKVKIQILEMCIRDRYYTGSYLSFSSVSYAGKNDDGTPKYSDTLINADPLYYYVDVDVSGTVSYTHLDVYKRQIYNLFAASVIVPVSATVITYFNCCRVITFLPFLSYFYIFNRSDLFLFFAGSGTWQFPHHR